MTRVIVEESIYRALETLASANGISLPPAQARRPRTPIAETALTNQELQVIAKLTEVYPDYVPFDGLVCRTCNTETSAPGDILDRPATQVCRIRSKLGNDVIETVWPTRVNPHGKVVKETPHSQALGYRASENLMREVV